MNRIVLLFLVISVHGVSASSSNRAADTTQPPNSVPRPMVIASSGGLKMLYDNRAYPQAVAVDDSVHIVWRGHQGYPYLATYLHTGQVTEGQMLLQGLTDEISQSIYKRDHL